MSLLELLNSTATTGLSATTAVDPSVNSVTGDTPFGAALAQAGVNLPTATQTSEQVFSALSQPSDNIPLPVVENPPALPAALARSDTSRTAAADEAPEATAPIAIEPFVETVDQTLPPTGNVLPVSETLPIQALESFEPERVEAVLANTRALTREQAEAEPAIEQTPLEINAPVVSDTAPASLQPTQTNTAVIDPLTRFAADLRQSVTAEPRETTVPPDIAGRRRSEAASSPQRELGDLLLRQTEANPSRATHTSPQAFAQRQTQAQTLAQLRNDSPEPAPVTASLGLQRSAAAPTPAREGTTSQPLPNTTTPVVNDFANRQAAEQTAPIGTLREARSPVDLTLARLVTSTATEQAVTSNAASIDTQPAREPSLPRSTAAAVIELQNARNSRVQPAPLVDERAAVLNSVRPVATTPTPTPVVDDSPAVNVAPPVQPAAQRVDTRPAPRRDINTLRASIQLQDTTSLAQRGVLTPPQAGPLQPAASAALSVPEPVRASAASVDATASFEQTALRAEQAVREFTRVAAGAELRPASSGSATAQGNGVSDQVVQFVTRQQLGTLERSQLTLQLKPAELGALQIELSQERGELSVAITAREGATRDLLEGSAARLRQSLEEAGIQLADLELRQDGERRRAQTEQTLARRSSNPAESTQDADIPERRQPTASDRDLDIYV